MDQEGRINLGFNKKHDRNEIPLLLLCSSNNHLLSYMPEKVKQDLRDYFHFDKRICNLQKAQSLALGRWVSYELLKDFIKEQEFDSIKIKNSESELDWGRPHLYIESQKSSACLSISHSDFISVACYSENENIGVDIEKIQSRPTRFEETILTNSERVTLKKWNGNLEYLLTCFWTAKESVSKALGQGLRIPIQNIEIIPELEDSSVLEKAKAVYRVKLDSLRFIEKSFSVVFSSISNGENSYVLSTAKFLI